MNIASVKTSREAKHLDSVFQSKVGRSARKLVAKQEPRWQMKMQMENVSDDEAVRHFDSILFNSLNATDLIHVLDQLLY